MLLTTPPVLIEEIKQATPLNSTSGIQFVNTGGAGQTQFLFIRGARSEDTFVLIDGALVNDPSSPTRAFDFSLLDPTTIETIEIDRGAQGVLTGINATGGAVKITTKKKLGSQGLIEAGSFDTVKAAGHSANEHFHFNLSGFHTHGYPAFKSDGSSFKNSADRINSDLGFEKEWSKKIKLSSQIQFIETHSNLPQAIELSEPNTNSHSKLFALTSELKTKHESLKTETSLSLSSNRRENISNVTDIFSGENESLKHSEEYFFNQEQSIQFGFHIQNETGQSNSEQFPYKTQNVYGLFVNPKYIGEVFRFETGLRETIYKSHSLIDFRFLAGYGPVEARVSTGHRLASLYQLNSQFGNLALSPERALSMDISYQILDFKISAFFNHYTNLIDFNLLTSHYANVESATTKGLETEWGFKVFGSTRFFLSDTLLFTQDGTTGMPLYRRPQHMAFVALETTSSNIKTNLQFRYIGRRDDVNPITFHRIQLLDFLIVNLNMSYQLAQSLKATGRLENIFDRRYQEIAGYDASGFAGFVGLEWN